MTSKADFASVRSLLPFIFEHVDFAAELEVAAMVISMIAYGLFSTRPINGSVLL